MAIAAALHVTLVTHYFSAHRGGVEIVAGQLAQRVSEDGSLHVTWFASDCDESPIARPGFLAEPMQTWNGLERFGLPWPVWSLRSLLRLNRAVAQTDVVHLHDFIYFGNLAAFLFAKWHKKPILVTQHIGDIPYRNRLLSGTLRAINRTFGRLVLARADQVVFISDVVRKQFARFVKFRVEPYFWPNGVDTEIFFPVDEQGRSALRAKIGDHPERPIFLFVGRFVEKKGLVLLRRLAQDFAEVEWWFAGWGANGSQLDPASWKLPNVKLFIDRSGAAIAELYRAADLLILPSTGEGFPLVVQESMACGTPAIVSALTAEGIPAAREFLLIAELEDSVRDFCTWRNALRDVLNLGQLVEHRDGVAEFARSWWSWRNRAVDYGSLYRHLMAPTNMTI